MKPFNIFLSLVCWKKLYTGPSVYSYFRSTALFVTILGSMASFVHANENPLDPVQQEVAHENIEDGSRLVKSIKVEYSDNSTESNRIRFVNSLNDSQRTALINLANIEATNETRKTRDQVIAERRVQAQKNESKATNKHKQTSSLQSYSYVDFDIYDASSSLLTDLDYDGFYQTFSVIFDADVYGQYTGQRARVFADLYLSRNGGPWELYYTTDSFTIEDDSSTDEFEVLTTLGSGFSTSHYDVLIDLYEVGYSEIVATISSDDVDGLYALPLESADRDEVITDSYSSSVYVEGGSTSITILCILLLVALFRVPSLIK